jgi:hypothetical protein
MTRINRLARLSQGHLNMGLVVDFGDLRGISAFFFRPSGAD